VDAWEIAVTVETAEIVEIAVAEADSTGEDLEDAAEEETGKHPTSPPEFQPAAPPSASDWAPSRECSGPTLLPRAKTLRTADRRRAMTSEAPADKSAGASLA
jgi:hypothetical protein